MPDEWLRKVTLHCTFPTGIYSTLVLQFPLPPFGPAFSNPFIWSCIFSPGMSVYSLFFGPPNPGPAFSVAPSIRAYLSWNISPLPPRCYVIHIGTCEASRFDSNSNRTSRFEFNSKVTCRLEIFESGAHAVCRHTTNYAHSLFNKNINLCAVCSWDLCLQLHFTCSCTAVDRALSTYTTPTWQSALNM